MHFRQLLLSAFAVVILLGGLPAQAQADAGEDAKNAAKNILEPFAAVMMTVAGPVVIGIDGLFLSPLAAATDDETFVLMNNWSDATTDLWERSSTWD